MPRAANQHNAEIEPMRRHPGFPTESNQNDAHCPTLRPPTVLPQATDFCRHTHPMPAILGTNPTEAEPFLIQSVVILHMQAILHEKHQFRLLLFGHKGVEAAAVCLLLMVQGHLLELSAAHFIIATKTGLLAVLPSLGLSFTVFARHFVNRWTSSGFLGICTFLADSLIHPSHYPGAYTEAALTGVGAFLFSIAVSYTPVGKHIDRLAEAFLDRAHTAART